MKDYKNKTIAYCQNLKVGDKIKFKSEKQRYTVKAKDNRYLICTKPFNLQKTVLYTIVDLNEFIRGTNNMIFNPYDYTIQEDIDRCLIDLQMNNYGLEVSRRNYINLDIEIL